MKFRQNDQTKTYYSLNHRKPWLTIISSAVRNLRLPDDQHLTKIQIKFSISEIEILTRQNESQRARWEMIII